MRILRLVRNFVLLAVLALAAHTAAGANKGGGGNPRHCGGRCLTSADCHGGCACIPFVFSNICAPKKWLR